MHGLAAGLQLARIPFAEASPLARAAEDAGFSKVTVGDNMTEGFTLVGALGAVTRTAQIHTSIVTWTRTPVLTALAAMTAAELTGGRFGLGLGTMPQAWSEDFHGIPYANPVGRMRDFIGADSLHFISFDGLYRAMGEPGRDPARSTYCDACFTGDYPTMLTDREGMESSR